MVLRAPDQDLIGACQFVLGALAYDGLGCSDVFIWTGSECMGCAGI